MQTTKLPDDGVASQPLFLQIEPSAKCNLRCRMCAGTVRGSGGRKGESGFMDMAVFKKIIDESPDAHELHLQGLGEPLLHPKFFDMVGYGVAQEMVVTTNSNLTVLTHSQAEACVKSGLSWIRVSIDGASPETYEAIRIGSRLGHVLQNVQLIRMIRDREKSASPRLFLVMVIMKSNLHELKDVIGLAGQYGLEHVFVQHLRYDLLAEGFSPAYDSLKEFFKTESLQGVDNSAVRKHFKAAREAAEQRNIGLRLPRLDGIETGSERPETCCWTRRGLYVTHDGRAMPCCMIGNPEGISFGNVASEAVADIWNNEKFRDFRVRPDARRPLDVCRSCSEYRGIF